MAALHLDEADDIIDICYDNVFKAVFTKNTPESQGALAGLLSAIIGRDLSVIAVIANEPSVDNLRDRQIRFDINCKAINGERVNVEMSLNPDPFEPVRLEFYAGKLFTSQDIQGVHKKYRDLKDAYQITFLVRGRFFRDAAFSHQFEYYDPEAGVSLGGRSRIITLELAKAEEALEKPVGELKGPELWGLFFRYITDKSKRKKINEIVAREEGIAMAAEVLISISRDEAERARLMSEFKYQMDTQSRVEEARLEGLQEGLQEGEQKGLQKGLQEGERKKAVEMAKALKDMGVPPEKITRASGLSPEEIAAL